MSDDTSLYQAVSYATTGYAPLKEPCSGITCEPDHASCLANGLGIEMCSMIMYTVYMMYRMACYAGTPLSEFPSPSPKNQTRSTYTRDLQSLFTKVSPDDV